jgi:hypothetical protein
MVAKVSFAIIVNTQKSRKSRLEEEALISALLVKSFDKQTYLFLQNFKKALQYTASEIN